MPAARGDERVSLHMRDENPYLPPASDVELAPGVRKWLLLARVSFYLSLVTPGGLFFCMFMVVAHIAPPPPWSKSDPYGISLLVVLCSSPAALSLGICTLMFSHSSLARYAVVLGILGTIILGLSAA